MKLKSLLFILLLVFSTSSAHAGFWDVITAPYNYVADLFTGDDTETVTNEPVVSNNDESLLGPVDTSLSIPDYQLESTFSSSFTPSYFNDPFNLGFTPSPSFYPSMYSSTYGSPNLSFGMQPPNYMLGNNFNTSCSAFDYSLCAFCFNLGLAELSEVFENQCQEIYKEVPEKRSEDEVKAYCACNEENNSDLLDKPEVKKFISDAVEMKKTQLAGEVISSFKKVARSVGLPKAHPYFQKQYTGEDARPEAACSADNFKNIIAELTQANNEGAAPCKQESLQELFDLAAKQSETCSGKDLSKASRKDKKFCRTYGGFDELGDKLALESSFQGKVDVFQSIFEDSLQPEFDRVKGALFEKDDLSLMLRGFGHHKDRGRGYARELGRQLERYRVHGHPGSRFRRAPASTEDEVLDTNEEEGVYNTTPSMHATSVEENHDQTMVTVMAERPEDFEQTYKPETYSMSMHQVLSSPEGCTRGTCFESMRILATEPFFVGPMMMSARRNTEMSPEMQALVDKVSSTDGKKSYQELNANEIRIIDEHSKKVIQNFKASAVDMIKTQYQHKMAESVESVQRFITGKNQKLAEAQASGNAEEVARLTAEISSAQESIESLQALAPTFQKIMNNPTSLTLDEITAAMKSVWEAQSGQLNMACRAVKTQAEAYCRLKENQNSERYSAVDVLGLNFDENKKIAEELSAASKGQGDEGAGQDHMAILDAMTCIQEGLYSKHPKSSSSPVYVALNGKVSQCGNPMDTEENTDTFPSFLTNQKGIGRFSAVLANDKTWQKWGRCGGPPQRNQTPASGDALLPGDGSTFDDVFDQKLGDVADGYKDKSGNGGYNSDIQNKLDKIKEKYGSSSSPGLANITDELNEFPGGLADGEVEELEYSEKSRGPASVEDQNGSTVVGQNGQVQINPLMNPNGQKIESDALENLDDQITNNNDALKTANSASAAIENKIQEQGRGNVDQVVLDQLEELRKQIAELKTSNEKLALERKLEIEKLKQEELEGAIASANSNNGNNGVKPVENRNDTVANFSTTSRKVVANSGNGSNGAVRGGGFTNSGGGSNGGAVIPSSSTSYTGTSRSLGKGRLKVGKSGRGVYLTGTTSSGEQFDISSADIINFEGRYDVTSFDNAVALAIQSSKNAFVFDGKLYVKKGDSFVEVKDIKEKDRAIASEGEVKDLKDVSSLLERLKEEEDDSSDNEVPVAVEKSDDVVPETSGDRKKVRGLWGIIMDNIFSFGSN